MADSADAAVLRGSLLDRLMAPETGRGGSGGHEYIGLRDLRDSVARDLEWLLNSKVARIPNLENFPEASKSILAYGVPDFSTYSWRSSGDAQAIAKILEGVIRTFEPRLLPRSVKVHVTPGGDVDNFRLSFRIDAVLNVDPIREPVSFDTDIDFDSSGIEVRGAD